MDINLWLSLIGILFLFLLFLIGIRSIRKQSGNYLINNFKDNSSKPAAVQSILFFFVCVKKFCFVFVFLFLFLEISFFCFCLKFFEISDKIFWIFVLCFVLYFVRTFLLVFLFYKFNLCRGVSPAQVFLCVFFGVSVICEFLFWCEMYVMSVFLIYFSQYLIWIYFLFFTNNIFYFDNLYFFIIFFKKLNNSRTEISLFINLIIQVFFIYFFFIIYAFHFILLCFRIFDFSIMFYSLFIFPSFFFFIMCYLFYLLLSFFIFWFLIYYYVFASMLSVACRFVCFYIFVIDMFCCLFCSDRSWVGQLLFSKDVCFLFFVCFKNIFSYLFLSRLLLNFSLNIYSYTMHHFEKNNNDIICDGHGLNKIYSR